jgi:hypothetical protein
VTSGVFATEPEPPIDIWDNALVNGYVLLIINPSLVSEVNLQQLLYEDGKVMQKQKVDFRKFKVAKAPRRLGVYDAISDKGKQKRAPKKTPPFRIKFSDKARKELHSILQQKEIKLDQKQSEYKQRFAVAIPVMNLNSKKMPDGYYASKFVAIAAWRRGSKAPLHVEQWVYLQSSKGRVKPISLHAYSRRVDPAIKGIDADGKPIQLNTGKGGPKEIDINETKKSRAIPLGRLGGEPLEQEETRSKPVEKKTVDESNER